MVQSHESCRGATMPQKLKLFIAVLSVLLFQPTWVLSIGLPDRWERAVFVIETSRPSGRTCPPHSMTITSTEQEKAQPEFCPAATGFLMHICGQIVLISNRHVFEGSTNLFIRAVRKSGGLLRLPVGNSWRAHPNPKIDLAASTVTLPPDIKQAEVDLTIFDEDTDRQATVPTSFFLDLSQLRAGDEILTVGFPSSIPGIREILKTHGRPLLRGGVISLILPDEITIGAREFADIFLVDSWTFQGNSGGPVFWKPTLQRYAERGFQIERPYIIGVVSAFLSWDATIQPGGQRVPIARTNAGLSIIQAASGIEPTVAQFPGAACVPRPQMSQ
jgi:hypothetical protein